MFIKCELRYMVSSYQWTMGHMLASCKGSKKERGTWLAFVLCSKDWEHVYRLGFVRSSKTMMVLWVLQLSHSIWHVRIPNSWGKRDRVLNYSEKHRGKWLLALVVGMSMPINCDKLNTNICKICMIL